MFKRLLILLGALCCLPAHAFYGWNMPRGVTPISHDIYALHMTIFYICCAIGALVFGVLIYALIKHRKSSGAKPAEFHSSLTVELIWTIIPFLILVGMAIPATKVLIAMEDDSEADINIKITGYQWKWKYDYLDEGVSFYSNMSTTQDEIQGRTPKKEWYLLDVDKPMVVPIHKKIRFLVTANDVIHSWWVPELAVKRDAIPGFIHEAWTRIDKPGTYRGQCAELCGVGHGFMPIVVIAKTEKEYGDWIKQQRGEAIAKQSAEDDKKVWTKVELMDQGKKTYESLCAVCHKPDGTGMPPAFPAMIDSKVALGPVPKHIDIILNGVKGTAMQSFKDQLSDAEIAAVVTYERNAWGNDAKAGQIVQPAEVAKLRK